VAGIGIGRRIGEVTPEEWRRVIDVNLTGTFLLSQAALAPLLASRGSIVNMASVAGLRATPYNAAYCAS
jgi:meso-butanediol dehydrogenase/(S,S)-butanediol dehydrogenase/diacetyl reductase